MRNDVVAAQRTLGLNRDLTGAARPAFNIIVVNNI